VEHDQRISKEDKAFLNVSNDASDTHGNNPDEHLEEHATSWEGKWYRTDDKINKAIHRMLLIIFELAKKRHIQQQHTRFRHI